MKNTQEECDLKFLIKDYVKINGKVRKCFLSAENLTILAKENQFYKIEVHKKFH